MKNLCINSTARKSCYLINFLVWMELYVCIMSNHISHTFIDICYNMNQAYSKENYIVSVSMSTAQRTKKKWRKTTWNKRQRFSTVLHIYSYYVEYVHLRKIWKRFGEADEKKSHVVRFKCKHYSFSACKIRLISVESREKKKWITLRLESV